MQGLNHFFYSIKSVFRWSFARKAKPYLAIFIVTVFLMTSAATSSPMLHQSFWIDWVWADQFTAELRTGNIYPRWLPRSNDGLGSSVFYYYPPLAFYVAGAFGLVGLSTYASVISAFAVAILISGVTMFHWLRGWTVRPLFASLIYMAAPYHTLAFYRRGALAEVMAIAIIPLVAIGLKQAHDRRRVALPALAFAGLIATHLPLAVLAIVFLILPYALLLTWRDPRQLAQLMLPFLIGVAIAAIYLVPAILLDRFRAREHLWILDYLRTDYWSIFKFKWSDLNIFRALVFATIASITLSALMVFAWKRSVWAAWAVAVCMIVAGAVPGFWSLPVIQNVQFPFRALPFAEFALATGIALLPRASIGILAALPALFVSALMVRPSIGERVPPLALLASRHPDVLEYIPPQATRPGWTSAWYFFVGDHLPKSHAPDFEKEVFYFPSWKVTCGGQPTEAYADAQTGLLSYRGEDCLRHISLTKEERLGQVVSAFGLAVLALLNLFRRRHRRMQAQYGGHSRKTGT